MKNYAEIQQKIERLNEIELARLSIFAGSQAPAWELHPEAPAS
jgi:hypothetical protein